MKRLVIAAVAAALALAAQARVTPISEGRLYTDLDAAGHSITNLPDGFFPTNGFLRVETDPSIGAFASTGAVARATVYGTPTRWTDATGCVWEVITGWRIYTNGVVAAGWTAWNYATDATEEGTFWALMIGIDEDAGSLTYSIAEQMLQSGTAPHWASEVTSVYNSDVDYNGLTGGDAIRAVRGETHLVGRVALTNDIPDVSGYATPADVTAAIREQSLGGIWDSRLGVWWTPIMENGALRYVATTNVNLSAEGNE